MNEPTDTGPIETKPDRRVVVGFDRSSASHAAIDFAFREAASRSATLQVIHAWDDHSVVTAAYVPDNELDRLRRRVHQQLTADLRPHARAFPDVAVTLTLVHGAPDRALLDAAVGAELLVVGSRGHSGLATLILGSTSTTVLQHARCPVVVVRDDVRDAEESLAAPSADAAPPDLDMTGS